jgi:DNA-binding beta-propeller fold protein YncE
MKILLALLVLLSTVSLPLKAEILAMMNYETKSKDSLKTLKLSGQPARREGIAVMDLDPESARFGDILMDIPLPGDLVAHHIFYDRTMTKAYVTALGKRELHVFHLNEFPYRLKKIEVPTCSALEDVIFTEDNSTWYITCMGTQNVLVGNTQTDEITADIKLRHPYPHGLAIHSGIDRILVTSTVRDTDLGDPGETITVIEKSTNRILSSHKVSLKESPSGEAPVEILFVPGVMPPIAYVTNMYGGTLWTATWDAAKKDFDVKQVHDFSASGMGVALEIYFNQAADRLIVTTGSPGHMHLFDISENPGEPKLIKSIGTAEGAHHVAITKDEKLAFVQNTLLNLPGLSDGEITVIDLEKQEVIARVNTLKDMGFNPNSIVLLPEWNDLAGH